MADEVATADETATTDGTTTTIADSGGGAAAFGPNVWLVDDMFELYSDDPSSVAESWRDFFEGYRREAATSAPTIDAPVRAAPVPPRPSPPEAPGAVAEPLKGAAAL
ncbi:MAG: hypothetical protein M3159_04585, partial [Actinomycetota bacterium]|nr:hypothetical protein [Actinomycetota bacterium]